MSETTDVRKRREEAERGGDVEALVGDDIAYWINNPFLPPELLAEKVRHWISTTAARVRAETLREAADAIVQYAWQPGDGISVPADQQAFYIEAAGNAIDVSARVLRGMAEAGEPDA